MINIGDILKFTNIELGEEEEIYGKGDMPPLSGQR